MVQQTPLLWSREQGQGVSSWRVECGGCFHCLMAVRPWGCLTGLWELNCSANL